MSERRNSTARATEQSANEGWNTTVRSCKSFGNENTGEGNAASRDRTIFQLFEFEFLSLRLLTIRI